MQYMQQVIFFKKQVDRIEKKKASVSFEEKLSVR